MGKVGSSPDLEDRPNVPEAQRRHVPTNEEAEEPGAQDQAWHPLCPSTQARRDPTPRVWADTPHPVLWQRRDGCQRDLQDEFAALGGQVEPELPCSCFLFTSEAWVVREVAPSPRATELW